MSRLPPGDALIDRLVADARPVRRLWPPGLRLVLWWALPIAIVSLDVGAGSRADLAQQIEAAPFVAEVGACAAAALLLGWLALRAAVPGREPAWGAVATASLPVLCALLVWRHPVQWDVTVARFTTVGIGCAAHTVGLALAPWIALLLAARRGAPFAAAKVGGLAGAAAFLAGYASMRLICPIDEALHLLIWHGLPVAGGVGLSAVTAWWLFRRWRKSGAGGATPMTSVVGAASGPESGEAGD